MLEGVGTGFTFRFREWLRRSDKAEEQPDECAELAATFVKVAMLSGSDCPVGRTRNCESAKQTGEVSRWP